MSRPGPGSVRSQRGVALIVLAVLLVLGVTWFLVSGLSRMTHPAVDRSDNAEVLAQAKSALIGKMVTDASDSGERNPGRLPCPEAKEYIGTPECEGLAAPGLCKKNDGTWLSAPTCDAVGRLPWRTLGLPKLLDASGEPLWYVVSSGWALQNTTTTLSLNSDSAGNLSVDGQANAAVALIVAPGGPIVTAGSAACSAHTQQRGVTPLDVCNYLEAPLDLTVNPAATPLPTPTFATTGPAGSFNDQVLRITAADVIPPLEGAIAARMQRDLARVLADATQSDGGNAVRFAPVPSYYPFAATWTTSASSTYAGVINTSQGMLPLVRSRKACDPLTDPACDATLKSKDCDAGSDAQCDPSSAVRWRVGSAISNVENMGGNYGQWTVTWDDGSQVTIELSSGYAGNGRIGAVDCAGSSGTMIACVVSYGRSCPPLASCSWVWPKITVTVDTNTTAALTFRRLNPAILDSQYRSADISWLSGSNLGAIRVVSNWQLPVSAYPCNSLTCSQTTIQIPSLYIEDNVPLQSRLREAPGEHGWSNAGDPELRWILTNNWQRITYYAVTTRQVPGGAGACNPSNCLSVSGVDASLSSQQAVLALAGRALAGQTHSSASLNNFFARSNVHLLPPAPPNRNFEVNTVNKVFNDRIVLISPRP